MESEQGVIVNAVLLLENFHKANIATRMLQSPSDRVKYCTTDNHLLPQYEPTTNGFKMLASECAESFENASDTLRVISKLLQNLENMEKIHDERTLQNAIQNTFDMLNYSRPLFQNLTRNEISIDGYGSTPVKYSGLFQKIL